MRVSVSIEPVKLTCEVVKFRRNIKGDLLSSQCRSVASLVVCACTSSRGRKSKSESDGMQAKRFGKTKSGRVERFLDESSRDVLLKDFSNNHLQ